MKLSFEYGHGLMEAEFPDHTDVFIPGVTVPDPACIDENDIVPKTLESIRNPVGMESLSKTAKKGSKCVIVFPDRVKGGEQPTSHRKTAIPLIVCELYAAGVEKKDILLVCSTGLHRKNTKEELFNILGKELFTEFWHTHQIINHDSEDYDNLVDLGSTASGDPVLLNRSVYEADIAILIGHVQGNPYGGYSGGYKHCVTGLTHWRSIASHHVPEVMHRPDFIPVSSHSMMRTKFDEIGMHMETKMNKKFFCCDAVLDTKSRQIAVFSGWARDIQPLSWKIADRRTYVPWAEKKYDIMVFGMPRFFHYGDGMGTNPIMMMQAISAQVIRHKRVLKDNCVIICSSICDGYFHDELFSGYREVYELFQKDKMNILSDMNRYGEYFATDAEYIRRYRFANAFHPFHAFSMISCGHIAEENTAAIYLVGAYEPGYARAMGMKTRATFEQALEDAQKKFTGCNPAILALPGAFKTSAVHLCMKGDMA
jgi:hypothetical protein